MGVSSAGAVAVGPDRGGRPTSESSLRIPVPHGALLRLGPFHRSGTVGGPPGLDEQLRFGAFTLSGGPRIALGDGDFTRTYFGVRPFEAVLNGALPAYRPSGGVTSVGLATALSYDWSPQWSSTVSASYSRLVSDAADSPIVKRFGSENQFTFGASLSYSFAVSGW